MKKLLKALRQKRGLTMHETALLAQTKKGNISSYENPNGRKLYVETFVAIANALRFEYIENIDTLNFEAQEMEYTDNDLKRYDEIGMEIQDLEAIRDFSDRTLTAHEVAELEKLYAEQSLLQNHPVIIQRYEKFEADLESGKIYDE